MITAVFDLDRTLLPGTTAERIFLRYLVRRRVIGAGALTQTVQFLFRERGKNAIRRVKADRPYLTGLHDARLWLEGRRCAIREVLPAFSARGLEYLQWHQQREHQVVLLSGSLPYIVKPLAEALDIPHVICSEVEVKGQRLTGRLSAPHPYGDAKAQLMLSFGQTHDVDFNRSYCYADHHTDEMLLQLFGNPICVNPSERLQHIARENSWRVEAFD
jgi:HAD superfamily hydrolase (TIGR01490 family)